MAPARLVGEQSDKAKERAMGGAMRAREQGASETSTSHSAQISTSSWAKRAGFAASLLTAFSVAVCAGCPGGPGSVPDGGPDFDDHTVPRLVSEADYSENARVGPQSETVKFIISNFADGITTDIRYMESKEFYSLHDEWYWFRLLNGASAPGSDRTPVQGLSFDSIADIYTWANAQADLPLDLRYVGARLYSPEFYALALNQRPRVYGLGNFLHFPARTEPADREEIWAFELEYSDDVSHAELVTFFEMLVSTVPPSVGPQLKWLVRSPAQEQLATRMEELELPWHDRILRYRDITVAGEVEVYSEGLTAGRLRLVRSGESGIEDSRSTDVLVVEEIPDYLPPTSALLTALPQTPLAHINVLARNRGIPNAYVAGIFDDPEIDSLGRVNAPVAVRAIAAKEGEPASLDVLSITESQFASWRALASVPTVSVPVIDTTNAPHVLELEDLALEQVETLRPLIGGKAAGFLALLAPSPELEVPDKPTVITARLFREHLALYRDTVDALLDDDDFTRSARTRFLALEGPEEFRKRYVEVGDARFLDGILERPEGNVLADVVRAGGLVNICESTPLPASSLATIRTALEERYAAYSPLQGLRFRSSSTVEDIEGFNGAGLYTSNTGFLFPEEQPRTKDQAKTVERAILRTFSSYWGSEAFEERQLGRVIHLSGSMAVLVHARFDDDKEMSNGVFTFTVNPPEVEARTGDRYILEVNVQTGALSVTNPPPGSAALPEVFFVRGSDTEAARVERISPSSELPPGSVVFSDAMAVELYDDAKAVTLAWLEQENDGALTSMKARSLTLDFELREMDRAWPLLSGSNQFARRVVIKQARSLEPGLAQIPEVVREYPLPRDLIARARRVERRDCGVGAASVSIVEVYSDPLSPPNLGYDATPFTGFVTVSTEVGVDAIGWSPGYRRTFVHGTFDVEHPGLAETGEWAIGLTIDEGIGNVTGVRSIAFDGNEASIVTDDGTLETQQATCVMTLQYSTPDEYLTSLFVAQGE